ncbi:MAG: hypothetical protein R2865_13650 [Deinococcales bacterium]
MLEGSQQHLYQRFQAGQERALARMLSELEAGSPAGEAVLKALRKNSPKRAQIVGITGSPGSGKSTLTDALIATLRAKIKKSLSSLLTRPVPLAAGRFWATASA